MLGRLRSLVAAASILTSCATQPAVEPAAAPAAVPTATVAAVAATPTPAVPAKPAAAWADAPTFLGQCQADANLSARLRNAVAAGQQQQLARQAGRQRPGVQIFQRVEHQAQTATVQAQQCVVQLHVRSQQGAEVGLAHGQQRGGAMGMAVVRARQAVEQCDVAEPGARLHIGERNLPTRQRHRADPHRTGGHAAPFLGARAAHGHQFAVHQPSHAAALQDVLAQRFGKPGKPWSLVDVAALFDRKGGRGHGVSRSRQS